MKLSTVSTKCKSRNIIRAQIITTTIKITTDCSEIRLCASTRNELFPPSKMSFFTQIYSIRHFCCGQISHFLFSSKIELFPDDEHFHEHWSNLSKYREIFRKIRAISTGTYHFTFCRRTQQNTCEIHSTPITISYDLESEHLESSIESQNI